jgi:hypothetical protein
MNALQTLHKPLQDMLSKSKELASALASSTVYVNALLRKLTATKEAIVLRSLLRMLQLLHINHENPRRFILDYNLFQIVENYAKEENQILVSQTANKLLNEFQVSLA